MHRICKCIAIVCCVTLSARADDLRRRAYDLDVRAGSLVVALTDIAQQTGLQIIYPGHPCNAATPNECELQTTTLQGRYTVDAAITELGRYRIAHDWVNERTVAIQELHTPAIAIEHLRKLPPPLIFAYDGAQYRNVAISGATRTLVQRWSRQPAFAVAGAPVRASASKNE